LLNLLESLFNGLVFLHFLFHLALEELTPELLDHKVTTLFNFVSILAIVLGVLSNLGLSINTVFTLLEGLVFVLDRDLESADSFRVLLHLVLDVVHQILVTIITLQFTLTGCDLLVGFIVGDLLLGPERLG
jgi:hypothetical protein